MLNDPYHGHHATPDRAVPDMPFIVGRKGRSRPCACAFAKRRQRLHSFITPLILEEQVMKTLSHIILASLVASGAAIAVEGEQYDQEMQETLIFEQHDINGDGYLTTDEWSDASVNFNDIDANGDQLIDEQELQASLLEVEGSGQPGMTQESDYATVDATESGPEMHDTASATGNSAFGAYDQNGDGYLDEGEIRHNPYLNASFSRWDRNNDGLVGVQEADKEFLAWDERTFRNHDINHDGYLDEEEVVENTFARVNFKTWDENEDGLLGLNEVEDSFTNSEAGIE